MDETEELIEVCVRALVAQMSAAPGIELHMTRACVLGLTDEPLADFNRLILGPDPDAEGFLVRSAARAKERGRPLMATRARMWRRGWRRSQGGWGSPPSASRR